LSVSKEEFRRTMRQFASGVTIVTTRRGDELHGMTATAFASVSLEPLLVLVCVEKTAESHDILKESGVFAVNILSDEQESLSRQFADKSEGVIHRLESIPHRSGSTGAPIIEGCLAYLECRIVTIYEGGDHSIFLGQVEEARVLRDGRPLIFFRSAYRSIDS